MSPDAYCQQKTAQSGSSFYYSFRFLPPARRRAITALYAFCREVDDIVDEHTDTAQAALALDAWRRELDRLYAGTPQHPVSLALASAISDYNLPQAYLHEIITGMAMDLDTSSYPDFTALRQYCYRVASVVGLLSARIFGVSDEATLRYANDLGMAFQLTNIIRDVGEDAKRGRIYLPADELARFGVSAEDLRQQRYSPAFKDLMAFQIARAEDFYQSALDALPAADRQAQKPGLMMAAVYRSLLAKIKRSEARYVLTERTRLAIWHKLWLVGRAWFV